jgi:hypothetical protein
MKKLRIYLDTSVVNFLFAEDAPDFRRVTEDFFGKHARKYELYTSDVLLVEISSDPKPEHRQKLFEVLQQHPIAVLPTDRRLEVERLVELYLAHRVIPASQRDDAFHVAYATVFGMDILLSWNFKHLANVRREKLIAEVNQTAGYPALLRLLSPLEVEDENQD